MNVHMVTIVIALLMFLAVLELVRRQRLTFKYAVAWLSVSGAAVFFAIFHKPLFALAAWLGFELPSNFIFFALFCAFIFLGLLLTVFLCQLNSRNDRMAQRIALLEFELHETKQKR